MADTKTVNRIEMMRSKILLTTARLFITKGYAATTLREIAAQADVNIGSLMHLFQNKENLLCELVKYVLDGQFGATEKLLRGVTDDKMLFWAAETTLQLYMAESNENVRELYAAAYSLPRSASVIYGIISVKLKDFFGELHPDYEDKDFYELEIASGGIIRGFMSVPCDMYFTMERKVRRYLETAFLVYGVSNEDIQRAIEFVKQFDFENIAQQTITDMLGYLENMQ